MQMRSNLWLISVVWDGYLQKGERVRLDAKESWHSHANPVAGR